MADTGKVKMRVPASAKKGEWVTVKVLIIHPQKVDKEGKPENVLTGMKATYLGKPVVELEMAGAISTNPMIAFRIEATKTGPVKADFMDDKKGKFSGSADLTVA